MGLCWRPFSIRHIKGESIFRTIYIFPFAVSAIVTGVAWRWVMRPDAGLNLLLEYAGLSGLKSLWYGHPTLGILFITIASSWQFIGYIMALYLAGLRGISQEVREAAMIDGCNTVNLYRHIIIPMLSGVTFTAIVLTGMGCDSRLRYRGCDERQRPGLFDRHAGLSHV